MKVYIYIDIIIFRSSYQIRSHPLPRHLSAEATEHWMAIMKPAHWQVSVDAKEVGPGGQDVWGENMLIYIIRYV